MPSFAAISLASAFIFFGAMASPPHASACSGGTASLADGVRDAASIYYARVVEVKTTGVGFSELQLDVEGVVQGSAPAHISEVIANEACETIVVGNVGVVVLTSVDPFRDGRRDIYNLFYVLGPGRTSWAEAKAVLGASPPLTDTMSPPSQTGKGPGVDLGILAIAAISCVIAATYLRHRQVTSAHSG